MIIDYYLSTRNRLLSRDELFVRVLDSLSGLKWSEKSNVIAKELLECRCSEPGNRIADNRKIYMMNDMSPRFY